MYKYLSLFMHMYFIFIHFLYIFNFYIKVVLL